MVHLHALLLFPLLALATASWSYHVQDRYGNPFAPKYDETPPVVGSHVDVGVLRSLF
jgi:hypothetical protein